MHQDRIALQQGKFWLLCASIGLGVNTQADTVLLTNGDRISGEIIELSATVLKIKTSYAGIISLAPLALQSFETTTPRHWQINLKPHQTQIQRSNKHGHVSIDGKPHAITELLLLPAQARWKKSGLLDASLDIDNDKARKEKLHLNAELNLESKHWRHQLQSEAKRDKEQNQVTEDTIELNYTLDYFLDTHWLLRTDTTYREEGVTQTSQYWYLGAGPGYRLWGETQNKLDATLTYNRFWLSGDTVDIELSAWAAGLEYKQFWLDEKLELFSEAHIAYPTTDLIDYIANTSSGVRYYFEHNIHLSFKYDYNETRFIIGTTKDSSYILGAGVHF